MERACRNGVLRGCEEAECGGAVGGERDQGERERGEIDVREGQPSRCDREIAEQIAEIRISEQI